MIMSLCSFLPRNSYKLLISNFSVLVVKSVDEYNSGKKDMHIFSILIVVCLSTFSICNGSVLFF